MALPVTISNLDYASHTHHSFGPFKSSGGNFYVIGFPADASPGNSEISAWKATDPTSSFTEQDTSNTPNPATAGLSGSHAVQDGDKIHIVSGYFVSTSNSIYYMRFDMATDAWDIITGGNRVVDIQTGFNTGGNEAGTSLAVRSTGDLIAYYQGHREKDMGSDYQRVVYSISTDSGASWSSPVAVYDTSASAATRWYTGSCIADGDDRVHFSLVNNSKNAYVRTLSAADSLNTFPSAFSTNAKYSSGEWCRGQATYDSSGTKKVLFGYWDLTNDTSVVRFDAADDPTPTTQTIGSDISNSYEYVVNGTTVYLVYTESVSSDYRIFIRTSEDGAAWSSATEIDAETSHDYNRVHPNIYERSGTKLAYVYERDNVSGSRHYNEYSLTSDQSVSGPPWSSGTTFGTASIVNDLNLTGPTWSVGTTFGFNALWVDQVITSPSWSVATSLSTPTITPGVSSLTAPSWSVVSTFGTSAISVSSISLTAPTWIVSTVFNDNGIDTGDLLLTGVTLTPSITQTFTAGQTLGVSAALTWETP
jgi:hypothetical protein